MKFKRGDLVRMIATGKTYRVLHVVTKGIADGKETLFVHGYANGIKASEVTAIS